MLSLTATDLVRVVPCTGSRLLGKVSPVVNDRTQRDEGDAAHWLAEQVFKGNFNAEELIDRKAPNGVFITSDMVEHCEEYLSDILGKGDVEVTTNFSDNHFYEIRGRSDHVGFDGHNLFIDDFKYGWRIVEPFENWTLISHAIGWYVANQNLPVPERVVFTIYQPRPFHPDGNVRRWEISFNDLMDYWRELDTILKNPSDEIKTGPHCYKCQSMSQCPAAQIAAMNSIDTAEMAYDSEVSNSQLSYILDELKRAQTVLSQAEEAYSDLAMTRVRKGQHVPEYSLQTSKGNLDWNAGVTSDLVKMMTGVSVTKEKIITPTQASKAGVSQETIDVLCSRQNKGFKLVRVDLSKKAEKIFGKK